MKRPRITDIRATTVTVPLEAPAATRTAPIGAASCTPSSRSRPIPASSSLGEMGGGGESAEAAFRALKPYLVGHDPFELEKLRFMICNPTASLYNNRTQMHAALEFACLDIMGKFLGVPVYDLLGGKMRDTVPFASYMFFRLPNKDTGEGETRTADQLIEQTLALKKKCGFTTPQAEKRRLPPDYELEVYRLGQRPLVPTRSATTPTPPSRSKGDPLRQGHRGPEQRLLRGPGLGPERYAPGAREYLDARPTQYRGHQL